MSSLEAMENFGARNSKSSNIILVSTDCSILVILFLNTYSHYTVVLLRLPIFGFYIFFFLFQPSEFNANDIGYNDDYFPTLTLIYVFSLLT